MSNEIRKLLEDEIEREIQDLSSLDAGSKEKSSAIEDLTKLYKLKIEETRVEWEYDEKYQRRMMDVEQNNEAIISRKNEEILKNEQLIEQVKDRYFKLGMDVAEIVLPMIFYAVWMKRGFRFEETGTYTSTTFRGLFNRFKPTK